MAGWRVLTLSNEQSGTTKPVILIKHAFQATQYTVYLTDLVCIWQESLDRKSIIKKALQEDTSIDPSEGSDQLKLLLQHIQNGLDGGSGILKLQSGKDDDSLSLHLTVDLPVPLQPLVWVFALTKENNDLLFQQFQAPVLERSFGLQSQVQSLLTKIQEKDNIISRLFDKLESSGVEVSSVFPSAGSSRGSKAHVKDFLSRNVVGLKPFSESDWRHSLATLPVASKEDILEKVLAEEDSQQATQWTLLKDWRRFLDNDGEMLVSASVEYKEPSPPPLKRRDPSKSFEDAFQNQDVSKLARFQSNKSNVLVEDSQPAPLHQKSDDGSTTEDEADLTGPMSSPPHLANTYPDPEPAPAPEIVAPRPKKLGVLGGKRAALFSSSPPSEMDSMDPAASQTADEKDSRPNVPVRKLGKIGGKAASTLEQGVKPSVMGLDGDANIDADAEEKQLARKPPQMSKTPPRETSTERADRKREELKHDLEEKRKAMPKKKRKF